MSDRVWEVLESWLLCSQENEFSGFLVFTDADRRKENDIHQAFRRNYQKWNIEYDPEREEIFFEGKKYKHSIYIYPQNGNGAVEKILLQMAESIYPELSEISFQMRQQLLEDKFAVLRKKNWAAESEVQEFYADKVQFGSIAMALKPDRPVGFAIKDNLVKRNKMLELMKIEEFQKLCQYLQNRIK